jgi:putative SOS response-associated peptidase YedK
VPPWADLKLARQTYNARSETVASKPSFRNAWKKRQFCIIPAEAVFEPSYETGRAVRWQIEHARHEPLGIAGIWDWRPNGGPDDQPLVSFSMLTINADEHPLMRRFHKPGEEKRMVAVIEPDRYQDWLHASLDTAPGFLQPIAADELTAHAAPRPAAKKPARPARPDDLFAGL